MQKTIGILGGLGPQTTAEFYLKLVELGTKTDRPAILIWSLPLNLRKESEYIRSGKHKGHYVTLLQSGVQALEGGGSDFIVIPCNTVHEFYSALVGSAKVPIVNLIEVVAAEAKSRRWDRILLLATSQTVKTRLYQEPLEKRGVDIILPSQENQVKLNCLIQDLLDGKRDDDQHHQFLRELTVCSDCDQVVLGCTDLQLVFPADTNCIDSMEALVKHTVTLL